MAYDKLDYERVEAEKASRNGGSNCDTTSLVDESEYGGVSIKSSLLDTENEELIKERCNQTINNNRTLIDEDIKEFTFEDREAQINRTWASKCFPNAPNTPAQEGFSSPSEPVRFDRKAAYSYRVREAASGPNMKTDWDHADFEKNTQGQFMCPFESCKYAIVTEFYVMEINTDQST